MRRALPILLLALAATTRADHIQFRNGGKLEGVITGETTTDITIKTGPGSATFKKSQITSIYRDAPETNARRTENWRAENWDSPEFLPPALRPLAADLRALGAKRTAALDARTRLAQLRAAAVTDEAEYKKLEQQRAAIVLRPPDTRNHAEVAAYNQLVETSNGLVNRTNAINQRRPQLDAADKTARTNFSAYLTALRKFRDDLLRANTTAHTDEHARRFLTNAARQIETFTTEISETRIPLTDTRRGHATVTARFNDQHDAKLLVDTGATFVSLPIATARRLKLDWDEKRKSTATLADGTEVDVYLATIRRLTVAGAMLENVPAIIMPDATSTDTDGLLGMSFLREFDVQLDSSTASITLRRLPPAK